MAYQVLARKWRPRNFHEVMGQQHVLQALSNALDQGRLHHAYLFSGTRGVGKTTIARILAKCLNCETGVTSRPCGVCSACQEIDQGNFVDLLEIDAASRTKVEDTRDLLDNVQYKPARGRYKIYLIDEVHMLSRHSFNALLKTLEEPPEHVKFLLATTDPQKLPITILSRCLQFHLKALTPEQIVSQLEKVLRAESLSADDHALSMLAKAAKGSMRDALSLTDQAIAYGNGALLPQIIQQMLGTMDQQQYYQLIQRLAARDASQLMQQIAAFCELVPDFEQVFSELAACFHKIAVCQLLGQANASGSDDISLIQELAETLQPAEIQLFYQITLQGRKELPLSPDGKTALEMSFLRMLAFAPGNGQLSPTEKKRIEIRPVVAEREVVQVNNEPPVLVQSTPVASTTIDTTVVEPDLAMHAKLNQEQSELIAQAEMLQQPMREEVQPVSSTEPIPPLSETKTNSGVEDVLRLRNQLRSRRKAEQSGDVQSSAPELKREPIASRNVTAQPKMAAPEAPERVQPLQVHSQQPTTQADSSPAHNDQSFARQDDLPPWELPPLDSYQDDFSNSSSEDEYSQPENIHRATPAPMLQAIQQKTLTHEPVVYSPVVPVDEDDEAVWRSNELLLRSDDEWSHLVANISATGRTRQLAMQSRVEKLSDTHWRLLVRQEGRHLTQKRIVDDLMHVLSIYLTNQLTLDVQVVDQLSAPCPAEIEHLERARLQVDAENLLIHDPNVQFLQQRFGAILDNDTIQALKTLNKSDE